MPDINGHPWAKLSDLHEGSLVIVTGLLCIPDDSICQVYVDDQDFYVECSEGKHYLAGQLDFNGDDLIGVYHAS